MAKKYIVKLSLDEYDFKDVVEKYSEYISSVATEIVDDKKEKSE